MTKKAKKTTGGRLTNYMEELTGDILDGLITTDKSARFDQKAKQDIKALALNRLWPMYTTSMTGKDFLKKVVEEDQIEKDIVRELKAAMAIVKAHPASRQRS